MQPAIQIEGFGGTDDIEDITVDEAEDVTVDQTTIVYQDKQQDDELMQSNVTNLTEIVQADLIIP